MINLSTIKNLNPCQDRLNNYVKFYRNKEFTYAQFLGLKNITHSDKIWVAFQMLSKEKMSLAAADIAELVLHIYENRFPNDKRPREAVEVARSNPTVNAAAYAYSNAVTAAATAYAYDNAAAANAAYATAYAIAAYESYAYANSAAANAAEAVSAEKTVGFVNYRENPDLHAMSYIINPKQAMEKKQRTILLQYLKGLR